MIAATIDIILAARTEKLDKGLAKGQKGIKGFIQSMNITGVKAFDSAIASLATKAIGFGAGLFAAERLLSGYMKKFNELEALTRTSDALGIQIDKLAGIQLQARDSSIEIETLNAAIVRLGRTTGAANAGIKTSIDTLNLLGISARKFGELPLDEQFKIVAEKISQMDNATDKLLIVTKIFGREGAALIPILNQGAKGFDDAQRAAEKYRQTLTEIDKRNIEKADAAMDHLSNTAEGFKTQIVLKTVPAVLSAVDEMSERLQKLGKLETMLSLSSPRGVTTFGSRSIRRMDEVDKSIASAAKEMKNLTSKTAEAEAAMEALEERTAAMDKMMAQRKADEDFLSGRIQAIWEETRLPEEKLHAQLDEFFSLWKRGFLDDETYRRAVKMAEDELRKLRGGVDLLGLGDLDKTIGKASSFMARIGEKVGDKFKDIAEMLEVTMPEDIGAPAAIEAGSAEAFSLVAGAQRNEQQQQLEELRKTKEVLTFIWDKIRRVKTEELIALNLK